MCGAVNGVLVTRLGLPSLAVTIGTLALYRGLAQVLIEERTISGFPKWFTGVDYSIDHLFVDLEYVHSTPIVYCSAASLEAGKRQGSPIHHSTLG